MELPAQPVQLQKEQSRIQAQELNGNSEEKKLSGSNIIFHLKKDTLKKVTLPSNVHPDDHFSNLFTRKKTDGNCRTILNLKFLNKECDTQNFKMESIRHAIYMIKPEMFLASPDDKNAFYHKEHQKFLKFLVKGKPLQLDAMPCES